MPASSYLQTNCRIQSRLLQMHDENNSIVLLVQLKIPEEPIWKWSIIALSPDLLRMNLNRLGQIHPLWAIGIRRKITFSFLISLVIKFWIFGKQNIWSQKFSLSWVQRIVVGQQQFHIPALHIILKCISQQCLWKKLHQKWHYLILTNPA